jgi:hypothetical protein
MTNTPAPPEAEPSVLLAPNALQSAMAQPSSNELSVTESMSVEPRIDQLRSMAAELNTPLSVGGLTVLLAAGTQLKGVRADIPFAKADSTTPYTPARDIHSAAVPPLPEAIPKQAIVNQAGTVLEVLVNRWTDQNLAANTAYALKKPELDRRLRRAYLRIGGVVLGGTLLPAGAALATEERAFVIASAASLFVAAGDWGITTLRRWRDLAKIEDAGVRYRPFAITKE